MVNPASLAPVAAVVGVVPGAAFATLLGGFGWRPSIPPQQWQDPVAASRPSMSGSMGGGWTARPSSGDRMPSSPRGKTCRLGCGGGGALDSGRVTITVVTFMQNYNVMQTTFTAEGSKMRPQIPKIIRERFSGPLEKTPCRFTLRRARDVRGRMADGGRPITAADLGALFSDRCLVNADEPRIDAPGDDALLDTTGSSVVRSDERIDGPPRYGRRLADAWRPANDAYFGGGGAFPEIHVVQFPAAIGWDARCDEDAARKSRGRGVCSSQGTSQAVPVAAGDARHGLRPAPDDRREDDVRLGPDPNDPTHARTRRTWRPPGTSPASIHERVGLLRRLLPRVSAEAKAARGPRAKISADDVVSHLLHSHPNASR